MPVDTVVTESPAEASSRRASQRPGIIVIAAAAIAIAFFVLPLIGMLKRVAWSDLGSELTSPSARSALRLSLECSAWATGLSVLLGLPLSWVLARVRFPGKALVRGLVLLPLVLPPVVGGVALLSAFSKRGLVGEYLYNWFGIQFTFSTAGVVLAETFVALPFFIITVEAAIRSMDIRYEQVASTLGAPRWMTFRSVTLPLILPSLVAGAVLSWARALGEFGATITFAGNIEGRTRTLPLSVYLFLENQPESAIALSVLLLTISLGILVALRGRWLDQL